MDRSFKVVRPSAVDGTEKSEKGVSSFRQDIMEYTLDPGCVIVRDGSYKARILPYEGQYEGLKLLLESVLSRYRLTRPIGDAEIEDLSPEDLVERNFTCQWGGDRWRCHLYHHSGLRGGWSMAMRRLPPVIGSLKTLGFDEEEVMSLVRAPSGLVLFGGPVSSGKSTTMAAVIQALGRENRLGTAVTIEDPIEYLHDNPLVKQRAVGLDVPSFADGVRQAMRQTHDTIVIGEIREENSAQAAIMAGLSGRRVLATVHCRDVLGAISRMWTLAGPAYRNRFVDALQGVCVQHLVPSRGAFYVLYETLQVDQGCRVALGDTDESRVMAAVSQKQFQQRRETLVARAKNLKDRGLLDADFVSQWLADQHMTGGRTR